MNTGTNETIGTAPSTPSSDAPQPCSKTATTTPYAAPIESRLNAADTSGTQIDRKTAISSSTLSPTTSAMKIGSRSEIRAARSSSVAVAPPT